MFRDSKIYVAGHTGLLGLVEASIFAMQKAVHLENKHYNVGTGVDYSIQELAASIAETVGYKWKVVWDTSKPDGAPRKLLDSSKFFVSWLETRCRS